MIALRLGGAMNAWLGLSETGVEVTVASAVMRVAVAVGVVGGQLQHARRGAFLRRRRRRTLTGGGTLELCNGPS